jgi:hypothetical protein
MRGINDLSKATNQPASCLSWAINVGLIPGPDLVGVKRRYYSNEQFQKAIRSFSQKVDDGSFSSAQVSDQIGVNIETFNRWLRQGVIPAPATRKGRKTTWTVEQIAEIRKLLPKLLERKLKKLPPEGYYNLVDTAKELNMPKVTLVYWIDNKQIKKPSHQVKGFSHPLYCQNDLDEIKRLKADYFSMKPDK